MLLSCIPPLIPELGEPDFCHPPGTAGGGVLPAEGQPLVAVLKVEKVGARAGLSRQRRWHQWRQEPEWTLSQ